MHNTEFFQGNANIRFALKSVHRIRCPWFIHSVVSILVQSRQARAVRTDCGRSTRQFKLIHYNQTIYLDLLRLKLVSRSPWFNRAHWISSLLITPLLAFELATKIRPLLPCSRVREISWFFVLLPSLQLLRSLSRTLFPDRKWPCQIVISTRHGPASLSYEFS